MAEVVEMLRRNGATVLVDIRSFPASRRHPQWNRDAIPPALPAWLDYVWIPALGGRRHTPAGVPSPHGGWREKSFRDYADHMGTPEFAEGLAHLREIARTAVPAIMCSEAVPWRCHRRLVTDALLVAGNPVRHVLSPTRTEDAALTDFALVEAGRITYPPRDGEGRPYVADPLFPA